MWSNFKKGNNKYNAKKCKYKDSIYHSRLEAHSAMWLDSLLAQGKIKAIKRQSRLSIDVNGKHICNLYVDFKVTLLDGSEKYCEIKGFPSKEWMIKKNLALALSPIPYLVNPTEKELLYETPNYSEIADD